jgi:cytochrome b
MANRPSDAQPPRGLPTKPGLWLPMRVWDAPVRLFHWALVALVLAAILSIEVFNNLRIHMLIGQAILVLLVFRIVWGFIGSDTARFGQFLRNPVHAVTHLMQMTKKEPDTEVGHNAAGGWMVLVLLLVLLAQVATGLLSADEESFVEAPLNHLVGGALGGRILSWHRLIFDGILVLVGAHVLAVIAYAVLKRHNLVRPMITGKKKLPAATPQPRMRSPWLGLAVAVGSAVAVWVLVTKI